MIILQLRKYLATYTESRLLVNGSYAGVVLEDAGRPDGVKIPGQTCLPEGIYRATITMSPKFGRHMILIYNKSDYAVDVNGVRFTGIRVHEGTTIDNTDGCMLYGSSISAGGILTKGGLLELEQHIGSAIQDREPIFWVIGREFT
jgi:hypothetical protein